LGGDYYALRTREGEGSQFGGTFFHGLVGEVMVFDRSLSRGDEDVIANYLQSKWHVGACTYGANANADNGKDACKSYGELVLGAQNLTAGSIGGNSRVP
jgi:hypothetical protein